MGFVNEQEEALAPLAEMETALIPAPLMLIVLLHLSAKKVYEWFHGQANSDSIEYMLPISGIQLRR